MTRPRYQLRLRPQRAIQPVEQRIHDLIVTARRRFGFEPEEIIIVVTPLDADVPPVIRLRQLLKIARRGQSLDCIEASDSPESVAKRPSPRRKASKRASVAMAATVDSAISRLNPPAARCE